MKIPFSPPDITDAEINQVVEVMKSGWITTGPKTKELERKLADFVGTNKLVCLNSQTASGEMALRLLGIGKGDEVITCAYTYTATASVINHVGAKIVMVDCQKNSFEPDYDALENAINENTKVIIPVDLGGIPCDYDRIFEIVERKKNLFTPKSNNELGQRIQEDLGRVAVVCDAAHALGASYKGKKIGSIGDFTNFSFHAVKNFTTAEGGAITWRGFKTVSDEEIYKRIQLYSLHGQSKDALLKSKNDSWEYDIVGLWYKCNMTDIAAAMGLGQLSRYDSLLKRRREIIEKYDKAFKPLNIQVLEHYTDDYKSSGHLYITRIPNITVTQRNEIIKKMTELGVSVNVHYKPLPMMTAYKNLGFDIENYPNAYGYFANEITLPLHTKLTDEMVNYVIDSFCNTVKEYI